MTRAPETIADWLSLVNRLTQWGSDCEERIARWCHWWEGQKQAFNKPSDLGRCPLLPPPEPAVSPNL